MIQNSLNQTQIIHLLKYLHTAHLKSFDSHTRNMQMMSWHKYSNNMISYLDNFFLINQTSFVKNNQEIFQDYCHSMHTFIYQYLIDKAYQVNIQDVQILQIIYAAISNAGMYSKQFTCTLFSSTVCHSNMQIQKIQEL